MGVTAEGVASDCICGAAACCSAADCSLLSCCGSSAFAGEGAADAEVPGGDGGGGNEDDDDNIPFDMACSLASSRAKDEAAVLGVEHVDGAGGGAAAAGISCSIGSGTGCT